MAASEPEQRRSVVVVVGGGGGVTGVISGSVCGGVHRGVRGAADDG